MLDEAKCPVGAPGRTAALLDRGTNGALRAETAVVVGPVIWMGAVMGLGTVVGSDVGDTKVEVEGVVVGLIGGAGEVGTVVVDGVRVDGVRVDGEVVDDKVVLVAEPTKLVGLLAVVVGVGAADVCDDAVAMALVPATRPAHATRDIAKPLLRGFRIL